MEDIHITKFNIVKDESMKSALFNFLDSPELSKAALRGLKSFLSEFKDLKLDELTWETLCDIGTKIDTAHEKSIIAAYSRIYVKFVNYLIKNNLFNNDNIEVIEELVDLVASMNNSKSKRLVLFDKNINIDNIIAFTTDKRAVLFPGNYFVDTKLNNTFLVKLLKEFCISGMFSVVSTDFTIIENFVNSYHDFSTFTQISDFNYTVFKEQYNYYKNNQSQLRALVKFYIYLYVSSGNVELFKENDPIDMHYVQLPKFLVLYEQGFELINYNPFDPIPQTNKWLLKPNGFEKLSTTMNAKSYLKINFDDIEYPKYIHMVKEWFWSEKASLKSKQAQCHMLKNFLNFIYKHKKNIVDLSTEKNDYTTITTRDVYAYSSYIWNQNMNANTFNMKATVVKKFLNLCKDKGYLNVEFGVYKYLECVDTNIFKGGQDIPDEHIVLLEERLKKVADENFKEKPVYTLYYIIFHLLIDTHLRISSLLQLQTVEIKEAMKKGEYCIKAPHKTSNGDDETQPLSNYAYRHLEIAKRLTTELRSEASEEYSNYIFLQRDTEKNRKDVRALNPNTFVKFLKKQCEYLNLPVYTASNLRDTHMTKGIEFGLRNGLNEFQINAAISNHKSIITTNNSYVNHEMQLFAEALYGVVIGDIDVVGNIIASENTQYTKADAVDDECGFCKEDECYMLNEIGCPLCKGFVVTLDRIPFYEKKISEIDKKIASEEIEHEREHLHSLKRLYVAYLAKLYDAKGSLSNDQKEGVING